MNYETKTVVENGQTYEVEVFENGDKFWYQNGERHRLDGPAIEYADGTKAWCQNDRLHRLDGPAVEWADGDKEYWINEVYYSYEDWKQKVEELKNSTMNHKFKELMWEETASDFYQANTPIGNYTINNRLPEVTEAMYWIHKEAPVIDFIETDDSVEVAKKNCEEHYQKKMNKKLEILKSYIIQ